MCISGKIDVPPGRFCCLEYGAWLCAHLRDASDTTTSLSTCRPVVSQLSGALAALSVRAASWDPAMLLFDIQSLLKARPSLAAQQQIVAAQHHVQQLQPLIPHSDHVALQQQIQHLQQQHEEQAAAQGALLQLTALLHVLAVLPDVVSARSTDMHPMRRTSVAAALRSSPTTAALCHTALGAGGRQLELLALRVLQEWCSLGAPPADLIQHPALTQCVCAAVLIPETAVAAAECLIVLLQACGVPQPTVPLLPASDAGTPTDSGATQPPAVVPVMAGAHPLGVFVNPALMLQVLGHWMEAAVRRAADVLPLSSGSASSLGNLAPHLLLPIEVQVARCRVMCAGGAALLPLSMPMSTEIGGPDLAGQLAVAGGAEPVLLGLFRRIVDEVLDCISCYATDVSLCHTEACMLRRM